MDGLQGALLVDVVDLAYRKKTGSCSPFARRSQQTDRTRFGEQIEPVVLLVGGQ
jgi:hypothetical protein